MRLWSLIVAITVGCVACTVRPERVVTELAGRYTAQFPSGIDTLLLRADGTFDEEFVFSSGRSVDNHGTWSETRTADVRYAHLKGAIVRPFRDEASRSDWRFKAVPLSPGVQLELEDDPDGLMVFRKE